MAYERDPVSVLFDAGARRLLARAYANPGTWQGTRLANPPPERLGWLAARGINPAGRDPVPGGLARTRWARGFVRALYYQHKWWSAGGGAGFRASKRSVPRRAGALRVEVGRALPGGRQAGTLYLPGRAVRVKLDRGGAVAVRAVKRLPESQRIYDDGGEPAGRWADPARRDW